MGTGVTINFKDGLYPTDKQKHRLGVVAPDEQGDLWSYARFYDDVTYGQILCDVTGHPTGSGAGTMDSTEAVGSHTLTDTNAFNGDKDKWLEGALGWIYAGSGLGNAFYIRRIIDDSTAEIESLADHDRIVRGGWGTAVTGASQYSLWMPGLVDHGSYTGIPRGVFQGESADAGQFCWLKQTGWAMVKVDASGDNLVTARGVRNTSDGFIQGYSSTPTAIQVDQRVGLFGHTDLSGSADHVTLLQLQINNRAMSYSFSDDEHALNVAQV